MSTHGAYVARIQVREHPNADRLALGNVGGFQVVVSKETQDGSLGVFFSSELKVSDQYADANNLRSTDGGYFPHNLKVRAQRFRGEKSDGYFAPLSSLEFTGADLSKLKVGDIITELNGVPICEKYISPATARAIAAGQRRQRKALPNFPKHYDTEQLAYYINQIPDGSVVWLNLKLHGTSGRTGYIIPDDEDVKVSWWRKLFSKNKPKEYQLISGTRNVVLGKYEGEASKPFRYQVEERFKDRLMKNEIVFYEIVGWESADTTIMGRHNFSKNQEKTIAKWGDGVVYSYGLLPGTYEIYVYRIAYMVENEFGVPVQVDLPWPKVKARAHELGFKTPPEFLDGNPLIITNDESRQALMGTVDSLSDGPDLLDPSHPREGVVCHIMTPEGKTYALKHKGLTFKIGEGIAKERDDYVDAEEIS